MIMRIKDILLMEEMMSVVVMEKCLKLLEILLLKWEGRLEICEGGCVEGVVKKLLKVLMMVMEYVVMILWCLCYVFKEDKMVEEMVERSNGVMKLLVVI